jgi:thioredoxin-related protein
MKTIISFTLLLAAALMSTGDTTLTWGSDFEQAKTEAAQTESTILIVFSGSDWCKPCIQLHQTLFESEAFAEYAREHLVLVKADFPYRKKNKLSKEQTARNEKLAARYNPDGAFPLAVFTDAKGTVLGSFGYDKSLSPEDYISTFKKFLK